MTPAPATRSGPAGRLRWWLWFAPMLLICVAWALASPLSSAPDEGAHLVKAAAVARGHLGGTDVPSSVVFVRIGYVTRVHVAGTFETLATEQRCFYRKPRVTPACLPPFRADPHVQAVTTSAGRYPPYYYAPLVPIVRAVPSPHGYTLMRCLEALLAAALLASAFVSAQRLGRWAVVGVAVATTPMAFYLAGTINPNGLEIAADIALWASAAALARAATVDERLLARTAVAFVIAAILRQLSLPMAVFALVMPLVLASRARWREIARLPRCWVWVGVAALGIVAWLAWTVAVGPTPRVPLHQPFSVTKSLESQWKTFEQAVAWFGGFEVRVGAAAVVWAVALVTLGVAAFALARVRDAIVLAAVAIAAVALGVVIPLLDQPPLYRLWQGRYNLPVLAGVPILAGVIVGRRLAGRWARAGLWLLALALGVGQLLSFAAAARRYAVGSHGKLLYVLGPTWSGVVTPIVPLVLVAGGVSWATWRIAHSPVPAGDPPPSL